jgi:hypothetical protein
MSQIFPYISGQQESNQGLLVKNGTDKVSVFIDFSDGLLNSATTITTVSAIALDSTGATTTGTVVGTTAVSGQTARIDLQTCGAGGTSAALNGDRFRMTVTCTPSTGGPLVFPIFIHIDAPGYGVS